MHGLYITGEESSPNLVYAVYKDVSVITKGMEADWRLAHLGECDAGLCLQHCIKTGTVAYACDPNTEKVEAERTKDQGHPWLHIRFEASLRYMRSCLKANQLTDQPQTNKQTCKQTKRCRRFSVFLLP